MFVMSNARQLGGFSACLMLLLACIPNLALARPTDQQANEAYELVSSGCVAINNSIPFFRQQPSAISRQETDDTVVEQRRYDESQVRTRSGYGKVIIEQLSVSANSVPDQLKPVFALSLFKFFSRYGVGERRGPNEYFYGDGLFEMVVRFEKERLIEMKWTCGHD